MATPIAYPLINGFRHSGNSIDTLDLNGNKFRGFKSIEYTRTRTRVMVYGNHPDPIGKTRGKNEYKASVELYLAEWHAFVSSLGAGYGDVIFSINAVFVEGGFDTITDRIIGCTIDTSTGGAVSDSADPLMRKFDLNPLKIVYGGFDDAAIPLVGGSPSPQGV